MALRHASAMKQARRAVKRRERNRAVLAGLKTISRRLNTALQAKNAGEVEALLQKTASAWDRAATKGVIHPNKAAREVSHLTVKVNKFLSSQKSA